MASVIDKRYCRDCYYYCRVFDNVCCCEYIFITGKRRPCPAGVGCTVKLVLKKKKVNISVSKKGLKKVKKGGN